MTPTCAYDSYWRFAAERQAIYERRLQDECGPWTDDLVLRSYRFTNVYRAADRVSQYLIREIQYRADRQQSADEIFFRTLLFKIFNKIDTWEMIENAVGPVSWHGVDLNAIARILDDALRRGVAIYSAAYIMPAPKLGHDRKHANHLALITKMMDDGLPKKVQRARSLSAVYEFIKPYPGLGPFLAFQYAIDLNYSNLMDFDEAEFVVAGPGALDGIAKCFSGIKGRAPEEIIFEMVERQDREFNRMGLAFSGLYGRKLQPIDCQNVFCEISKYCRVVHPEIRGLSDRKRIKQSYRPASRRLELPFFPPRWNLSVPPLHFEAKAHQYQLHFF
jgi:alpha-glutamyl/putrescinyl thymine pyrophosphorylase clade 1